MTFVMNAFCCYLSNLEFDHYVASKKFMRFLQKTKDFKLVNMRVENLEVVWYLDSNIGGCLDHYKSTLRYILMITINLF